MLTQVLTVITMMSLLFNQDEARTLRTVDPLTAIASNYVFIKGDTRFKLTNVFLNPCERLFNYSTTIVATEHLIKHCFDYYKEKHLTPLTNCRRLPTIGPDLESIPSSYDCSDSKGKRQDDTSDISGKCEVIKRNSNNSGAPELELDQLQEAWNKHKKKVSGMPLITRPKRIVPLIIYGATVGVFSIVSGALHKQSVSNFQDIETISNVTNTHTSIIQETTNFIEQFKNSVEAIHTWAQDVEERLGNDPFDSRLNMNPSYRGKKASLVKTYMQWFNAQEKLLLDINEAASQRQVPPSLNKMLKSSHDLQKIANWSTLFDCSYQLVNKSMILELDFLLPDVDNNVEILSVVPMNVYVNTTNSSSNDIEAEPVETCWESYIGPTHIIHNKTNDCYVGLNEASTFRNAVRTQMCLETKNDLHYPGNRSELWAREGCTQGAQRIEKRIQIQSIDGAHKIYCFPYDIEIEGETIPCPNFAFILEAHANYKIGNITHNGALISTSVTRTVRSANRARRSPAPAIPITASPIMSETSLKPRINIASTLKNITGQMDKTLFRIKEKLKSIPGVISLRNATISSIFNAPIEILGDSFEWVSETAQSFGLHFGFIGICLLFIVAMPAIEIALLGLKVLKIPANLWIDSARRVSGKLSQISPPGNVSVTSIFKKKKRRWDDNIKMV